MPRPAEDFARRVQLVTPASNRRMLEKAATLACDSLVFDLEDGVAPAAKGQARENLRAVLATRRAPGEIAVRVNGLDTPWFLDDVLALQGLEFDSLVLPKVQCPKDVWAAESLLRQLELRGDGRLVTLQLLIESARGVESAVEIALASPRSVALIFGAGDYAADTGVAFTPRGLAYGRARIASAAAVAKLDAIDYVHPNFDDDEGLGEQVAEARDLGYAGKWAIHPRQVPLIVEGFSPDDAEVERARRILSEFESASAKGLGAVTIGGAMVDEAMLKIARRRVAASARGHGGVDEGRTVGRDDAGRSS